MANNIVHVRKGGDLDIAFRSWANSERHVISNNVATVDPGGKLGLAMDVRGFDTSLTGNVIRGLEKGDRLPLWITGSGATITGNHFKNVNIIVNDETGMDRPIYLGGNVLENAVVTHEKGNIVADGGDRTVI
jgi:hypothetical protein